MEMEELRQEEGETIQNFFEKLSLFLEALNYDEEGNEAKKMLNRGARMEYRVIWEDSDRNYLFSNTTTTQLLEEAKMKDQTKGWMVHISIPYTYTLIYPLYSYIPSILLYTLYSPS